MAVNGVVFEIQGLQGFKAALEKAVEEVRLKVGEAMQETAYAVRDRAQQDVSVDEGDLKAHIVAQGKKLNWRVGIDDGVVSSRRASGKDRIHQRPFIYGAILERGNKDQPARPFMRPAADAEESRFLARIDAVGLKI